MEAAAAIHHVAAAHHAGMTAGVVRCRAPMHPTDNFSEFAAADGYGLRLVQCEPKMDGWQVRFVDRPKRPLFLSRRGEELLHLEHLVEPARAVVAALRKLRLPSTYVLDCEMVHPEGYEALARLDKREGCELVVYDVWAAMPFHERRVALESVVPVGGPVRIMPGMTTSLSSEGSANLMAEAFFQAGFEGCVFKTMHHRYQNGDSPHWLRAVVRKTFDLQVISAEYSGLGVTNLICRYRGQTVRVGTGMSDAQRVAFMDRRPAVVEVERRDCHEGGSFQPFVFKRVREDKSRVD